MHPEKQEVYFFYFDVHLNIQITLFFLMLTKYLLDAYEYFMSN